MKEETVEILLEILEIIQQVNNANPLGAAALPNDRIMRLIHELKSMPVL